MSDTLFDLPGTVAVEEVWDLPAPAETLTQLQRDVFDFERSWPRWKHQALKEDAFAVLLKMTPNRYYQVLNQVVDCREALAEDPLLVNRLRRLRETWLRDRDDRRARIRAGLQQPRYVA